LNTEQASGAKQAAEAAAKATAKAAKAARGKEAKAKAAAEKKKQRRALSAEARKLYRTRCAVCHGSRGRGDGPAASGLNPKPRNFTDPAWKKSTSNGKIEKAIVKGGPAVGKSPLMPANPDLGSKPAIVKQLRRMVRRFK